MVDTRSSKYIDSCLSYNKNKHSAALKTRTAVCRLQMMLMPTKSASHPETKPAHCSTVTATYNKSRLEFLWLSLLLMLLLDGGGRGGRVASGLLGIPKAVIAATLAAAAANPAQMQATALSCSVAPFLMH